MSRNPIHPGSALNDLSGFAREIEAMREAVDWYWTQWQIVINGWEFGPDPFAKLANEREKIRVELRSLLKFRARGSDGGWEGEADAPAMSVMITLLRLVTVMAGCEAMTRVPGLSMSIEGWIIASWETPTHAISVTCRQSGKVTWAAGGKDARPYAHGRCTADQSCEVISAALRRAVTS